MTDLHGLAADALDRRKPMPNDPRAWIMRAAGALIGPERLAAALNIAPRTIYYMMDGRRTVKDGVLRDTRALILANRQAANAISCLIRDELGDAPAPPAISPADAAAATASMLSKARS